MTSAASSATLTDVAGRPSSTTNTSPTAVNHTNGGAPTNDMTVKLTMPTRLPARSSRDASSRGSCRKAAPTISPGPAITTATARKTAGSVIQIGGPPADRLLKKISWLLLRSTVTGYALTNPTRPSRTTSA